MGYNVGLLRNWFKVPDKSGSCCAGSAITSNGTGPRKFSPNFSWIWGVRVGAQKNPLGLCLGSFLQVGGERGESPI